MNFRSYRENGRINFTNRSAAAHVAVMTTHQVLREERAQLTQAYTATKLKLALMKKRLFIAMAERVDVSQLEIEFAEKLAALNALSQRLEPLSAKLTQKTCPRRGWRSSTARRFRGQRPVDVAPWRHGAGEDRARKVRRAGGRD